MSSQPSARPIGQSDQPPTFRKINADKVFACEGLTMHVWPGMSLLKTATSYTCPTCGGPVKDVSDTFLGQSYFAFGRSDLGK